MNRKRAAMVVAWIVAAGLAMLLASQAVALVRDQVTDRPSRAATTLALESTTSTTAPDSLTTSSTEPTTTSSSTTTSTTAVETTTTTATAEVTTTSTPPTSTTTTTSTANEEETFYLVGGWATVRCTGNDVALATYAPNPGFQVDIEAAGPAEVEIKFEEAGGSHRSKLEAQCFGGILDEEIEEMEDDD